MSYSKTSPMYAEFPQWGYVADGGAPKNVPQLVSGQQRWDNLRTGEKMENYKSRIRDGESAATPFTCDYGTVVSKVPGYYSHSIRNKYDTSIVREYKWQGWGFSFTPKPVHLFLPTVGAEAACLTKIYKKIKSEYEHMNSPAFFAEFLDVLHQFGHPAQAIIDLTNRRLNRLALERKKIVGSNSFKRIKWEEVVASTYLEYVFGLAPLIADTKKAAEAYARFMVENDPEIQKKYRARVSSRAQEEVSSWTHDTVDKTLAIQAYKTRCSVRTVTKSRCQYTVGLEAPPIAQSGSNERLLDILGFNWPNVIPAAWEGIPWSWLVDYFTNVQDILEAGAVSTASVKWISKSVSQVTECDYISRQILYDDPTPWVLKSIDKFNNTVHAGLAKVRRTTVNRTVPLSLGVPPLVIQHPFNDAKKIANMAAVMFSRRPGNSALWIY